MPWQELTGHVNGTTVRVRSKSGDAYAAVTESDHMNEAIYSQLVNHAHDDVDYWAWVEFGEDGPVVEDWARGSMPESPPWEHP